MIGWSPMGNSDALGALNRALHEAQSDIDTLAKTVTGNSRAVKMVVDGLTVPEETYRYNCNRVIVRVAETSPQEVYPYWNHLVGLLESTNTYHRCAAINVLPRLIPADDESKFDQIFDRFFARLDDESVIPPCYVARNCHLIAAHRPELVQRMVNRLLAIEATRHKPGRKDLIKADIIVALDRLHELVENRMEVISFVEAQLDCSSPKTRKTAKVFLEKHSPT